MRHRQHLAQAAEAAHVDDVAHGVHDAAGREEQERLEKGVGEQVEHARDDGVRAGRRRADGAAEAEEHVAELAQRGIGQHALEVVLRQGDQGGEQGREAADAGDDELGVRRVLKERGAASHEVDAGRDHRRGVDQGADRRRAFHGVGQPHVQRELGRLAGRPAEEQKTGEGDIEVAVRACVRIEICENALEIQAARRQPQHQNAEEHAHIADARDQERLAGRGRRRRPAEPEADQQVAAQADAFPAGVEDEQVVGQHEQRHREDEQRHLREEAGVAVIRTRRGAVAVLSPPTPAPRGEWGWG